MAKAKVQNINGSPALVIDGKVYPPMYATIRTVLGDESYADENYYKRLGESGIRIFFLICDTEWLKKGAFSLFAKEARLLLRAVPDAYIVMRIGMHAPPEWCKEHPDETLSYSDGKKKKVELWTESYRGTYEDGFYSFASEKWREDATVALTEIHNLVNESEFADRVIGYFFAAGGTSEWYYPTPLAFGHKINYCDSGGFETKYETNFEGVYGDLSPAFLRHFSRFLKEKYQSDEELQRAWGNPDVTLEHPSIPDYEARYHIYAADYDFRYANILSNAPDPDMPSNGNNIGQFLDIDKRRDVFDFFCALHRATADSVIHFGRAVRELDPDKVTGAFYGSAGDVRFYDFSQIGSTDHILKSGAIDFLASPSCYENRGIGGFAGQRQNFDSYRLKNAIFMVEDDVRTHTEKRIWRSNFGVYTLSDTMNIMKREFGRNLSQDLHSWWFDQILGGRRYKVEELYPVMLKMQDLAKEAYTHDRKTISEVALIYDEESYFLVSDKANQELIEVFRYYEVDRVGTPIDRYLHNDMDYDEMPDYKLYIFVNTLYLSDSEREAIHRKLRKNNASALFLYGSGVVNPDKTPMFSLDHIAQLTSIACTREDGIFDGKFRLAEGCFLTRNLPDDEIYGAYRHVMSFNASGHFGKLRELTSNLFPLLYPSDTEAEPLGFYLDSEHPAFVRKMADGFTSYLCGVKSLTADIVREIAREAGCHIYSDSEDVFYIGRRFLTHHASKGGEKIIHLPLMAKVSDAYDDTVPPVFTDTISFHARRGDTHTFRVEYEK